MARAPGTVRLIDDLLRGEGIAKPARGHDAGFIQDIEQAELNRGMARLRTGRTTSDPPESRPSTAPSAKMSREQRKRPLSAPTKPGSSHHEVVRMRALMKDIAGPDAMKAFARKFKEHHAEEQRLSRPTSPSSGARLKRLQSASGLPEPEVPTRPGSAFSLPSSPKRPASATKLEARTTKLDRGEIVNFTRFLIDKCGGLDSAFVELAGGDLSITKKEWADGCQSLGWTDRLTRERVWALLDEDKTGTVTMPEFLALEDVRAQALRHHSQILGVGAGSAFAEGMAFMMIKQGDGQ